MSVSLELFQTASELYSSTATQQCQEVDGFQKLFGAAAVAGIMGFGVPFVGNTLNEILRKQQDMFPTKMHDEDISSTREQARKRAPVWLAVTAAGLLLSSGVYHEMTKPMCTTQNSYSTIVSDPLVVQV